MSANVNDSTGVVWIEEHKQTNRTCSGSVTSVDGLVFIPPALPISVVMSKPETNMLIVNQKHHTESLAYTVCQTLQYTLVNASLSA